MTVGQDSVNSEGAGSPQPAAGDPVQPSRAADATLVPASSTRSSSFSSSASSDAPDTDAQACSICACMGPDIAVGQTHQGRRGVSSGKQGEGVGTLVKHHDVRLMDPELVAVAKESAQPARQVSGLRPRRGGSREKKGDARSRRQAHQHEAGEHRVRRRGASTLRPSGVCQRASLVLCTVY